VQARLRQHLRQALRLAAGQPAAGYDHKYTYSHLGYNLKITDMQAACGLAQLDRLEASSQARKNNFATCTPLPTPGLPGPARGHARQRPVLVRLPITLRPEAGLRRTCCNTWTSTRSAPACCSPAT
jgi:CDP-6-deoxy-D-xylo-4-hexulose-3-dehydrase